MKILSRLKTCTIWPIHHFKFQTKLSAAYSKYTLCSILRTGFKRKLQQTSISAFLCIRQNRLKRNLNFAGHFIARLNETFRQTVAPSRRDECIRVCFKCNFAAGFGTSPFWLYVSCSAKHFYRFLYLQVFLYTKIFKFNLFRKYDC